MKSRQRRELQTHFTRSPFLIVTNTEAGTGRTKIGRSRRWPKKRKPAKKMGLGVLRARLEELRARTPEPTLSANHGKTKAFIPALSGLSCHPFLPNV